MHFCDKQDWSGKHGTEEKAKERETECLKFIFICFFKVIEEILTILLVICLISGKTMMSILSTAIRATETAEKNINVA